MLLLRRINVSRSFLIITLVSVFFLFPAHAKKKRVLVLPVQNNAVGLDIPIDIWQILNTETHKFPNIRLLSPGRRGINRGKKCKGPSRIRCLSKLGRYWKADEVFIGLVTANSSSYVVDLALISVRGKQMSAEASVSVPDKADIISEGLRAATIKLLAPEKYHGSIRIDYYHPDAKVFLDGFLVGITPLESPVFSVPPGKHKLSIRKPGSLEYRKIVDVKYDAELVVRPTLKKSEIGTEVAALSEGSPKSLSSTTSLPTTAQAITTNENNVLPRWPGYTAIAIGGALIVSGLVQEFRAISLKNDAKNMQDDNGLVAEENNRVARDTGNDYRIATISGAVFLGVGAAAVIGGGTYLYLVPSNSGAQLGASLRF